MACNTQVTGCLQDQERSEKLALGWRWARHPVPLPRRGGVFASGGLAQHHGEGCARHKAQLHVQLPQPPSFLNLEFCFRAASGNDGKIICCGLCMFFYGTKKDFCNSADCFCFFLFWSFGFFSCLFVCFSFFFFIYIYLAFSLPAFSFSLFFLCLASVRV